MVDGGGNRSARRCPVLGAPVRHDRDENLCGHAYHPSSCLFFDEVRVGNPYWTQAFASTSSSTGTRSEELYLVQSLYSCCEPQPCTRTIRRALLEASSAVCTSSAAAWCFCQSASHAQ